MEQVARESGVTLGGELFSDALSKPEGPAPTYIEMFKNNVTKIVAAMRKGLKDKRPSGTLPLAGAHTSLVVAPPYPHEFALKFFKGKRPIKRL